LNITIDNLINNNLKKPKLRRPYMLVRELVQLYEARQSDLKYTTKEVKGKIDRVIVQLESGKSAAFTKLSRQYSNLNELIEQLEVRKNELNAETKKLVESYFDAEDEVLTRVVETVSMTATLSKLAQPTPKVDYENVVEELVKLMPELTEKVSDLKKAATTIAKPKSPMLSVKVGGTVKEGIDTFVDKVKKIAKDLYNSIKSWGKMYDRKLSKIEKMIKRM
jgi:predicted nuclease with TOPRIM domain